LEQLRSHLSPATREWLDKIHPESQRRILTGMMGALVFTQHHDALSEYLEKKVTNRERDILTSLPPEQMRQMLWWRYIDAKWPGMLPGPGRGRSGGPFPGSDGLRGSRRRFDRSDRGGPSPPFRPGDRPEGDGGRGDGPRGPRDGPGGRFQGPRDRPDGPKPPPEGPGPDHSPPPT
jgi:hypothetical protein